VRLDRILPANSIYNFKYNGERKKSILHVVLHGVQQSELHYLLQQKRKRQDCERAQKVLRKMQKACHAQEKGYEEGGEVRDAGFQL